MDLSIPLERSPWILDIYVTNLLEPCPPCTAVLVKQSGTVAHEGADHTGMVGQRFEKDRIS
jgi:hypothetical protein